jgi:hypothetical protein
VSISPTNSDSVMVRAREISFMLVQNGSSRLTLVLWPPTTIERFTTGDLTYSSYDSYMFGLIIPDT